MAHRKKRQGKKSKPVFREQVETALVDQLPGRFVALVRRGLELMLTEPSELVQKEFRQQPELVYQAADIPVLVLWTALGVLEQPWAEFKQHVLTQAIWQEVLAVTTAAELERV